MALRSVNDGVHVELVVVAVQIIDALRYNFILEILPRLEADGIAGIDGRFAISRLGARIGSPSLATSTGPCARPVARTR
jgi:hypothetical protein